MLMFIIGFLAGIAATTAFSVWLALRMGRRGDLAIGRGGPRAAPARAQRLVCRTADVPWFAGRGWTVVEQPSFTTAIMAREERG